MKSDEQMKDVRKGEAKGVGVKSKYTASPKHTRAPCQSAPVTQNCPHTAVDSKNAASGAHLRS